LTVRAAQRARLALPVSVPAEYDLKVAFTRRTGQHSIGLIVAHGGKQTAFEVDAWGSHLAGFQDVGGKSIRENATRREGVQLENGKRYTLTVEVRKGQLRGLLDDKEIAVLKSDGSDLSVSNFWTMPDAARPGLIAWESDTTFHTVELRSTTGDAIAIARGGAGTTPSTTRPPAVTSRPMPTGPAATASTTPVPTRPAPTRPAPAGNGGRAAKRVLIVIANQDFFYREYGEPRQEMERAGFRVTVAAGRKAECRPHGNSGQGQDGGVVQADLALADVKADDYDAVLFSGGWGASAYQFAFTGRYNNPAYNGDRAVKVEANRVINDFLKQEKHVCALCNGVSVLAWARVDGKSPLAGKRVCAPVREAAAGIYNGRQAQPSCRWHPESNGAILSPPGAVGRPNTNVDDVLVDGLIITGEDDPSAREMGRKIVEVLSR